MNVDAPPPEHSCVMGNEHGRAHLQRFSASEYVYSEEADQTFYWNILLQHVSKMRAGHVLAGPAFQKQAGPLIKEYGPRVISNERVTHNFARLVLKLHNSLNRYISTLPRLPDADCDLEEVYNDEEDLISLLLMFRLLCGFFIETLPPSLLHLMLSAAVPEPLPRSSSATSSMSSSPTTAAQLPSPASTAPTKPDISRPGTVSSPSTTKPAATITPASASPVKPAEIAESMPLASAGTLVLKQLGELIAAPRVRASVWREAARTLLVLLSVQRRSSPTVFVADPVILTLHTHPTLLRPRELIRTSLIIISAGTPLPSAASTLASVPVLGRWLAPAAPLPLSPFDIPLGLAEQLLLLLTVRPHPKLPANPFREALSQLTDAGEPSSQDKPLCVSFKAIFDVIRSRIARAADLDAEIHAHIAASTDPADLFTLLVSSPDATAVRREHASAVMLLYLLLTAAPAFAAFVRARTDLDELVLPLLQHVHVWHHHKQLALDSPEHLDLILVLVLILSRDSTVCESWRGELLPTVPWYREQLLVTVSVADLVIIVLTRIASSCIRQNKDSYRLTNSLAILGNLSSFTAELHPHAAKLLIDTLRTFLAKLRKLIAAAKPEEQAERSVCEDATVLLMEVLNVMLEKDGPTKNVHLLYELLYQSSKLTIPEPLSAQPVAESLSAVISFLQAGLEKGAPELTSSAQALAVLRKQVAEFPPDLIKKIPPLHFNYAENDSSRDFFVPYIWKIVSDASGVFFPPSSSR